MQRFQHLHSNMDRLKLPIVTQAVETITNLHSNMDRLKPERYLPVVIGNLFTFQYG